jgi:hypothetical protein
MRTSYLLATACASGLLLAVAAHAATQPVSLTKLAEPICSAGTATFDKATGSCKAPANLATLDDKTCPKAAGFKVQGSTCSFDPAESKPQCDTTVSLSYDPALKECVLVKTTPSSSPGSYVGDCFKVTAVPAGTALRSKGTYFATAQRAATENDRMLTLVDAGFSIHGCRAKDGGTRHEVLASTLVEHGARRYGWAFGALTMPYKYYRSSKEFQVGVPIGAYLGYRLGQAGSGYTLAGAFTVSQVKANTIDPNTLNAQGEPTVTGSTDVAALSWAGGVVFDLSKEPGTKPFKAGLFVGRDRINKAPNIDYKNNGKTWIALQIGFDFTDN